MKEEKVKTNFELDPESLAWDERGLLPVVVQDVTSGAVLMLAWTNLEALERTVSTGTVHFWSRSRKSLWKKGETSGNTLRVVEILPDCDRDTLLVRALPDGPTCHTGSRSCFEPNAAALELGWLARVLASRRGGDPEASYTARLLERGLPRVAQKVGEEAVETAIAALTAGKEGGEVVTESADLLYHLLVLWLASGVEPGRVGEELRARHHGRGAGEEAR